MAVLKVIEYQHITKDLCREKKIRSSFYTQLRDFALSGKDKTNDNLSFLQIGASHNEEYISAAQYVGIISLKNGDSLEIYPKITDAEDDEAFENSKKVLLRMLATLKKAPYKQSQLANLRTEKMPLLELFIRMFVDEVISLTKQGLRSGYENVEDNLRVYKGKLDFNKQIKYNATHKERFYVNYDVLSTNRVENRLIKSTLTFLKRISKDQKNISDINKLLPFFEEVEESVNYDTDFSKCNIDRNMQQYRRILDWCRVFLHGKSFTSYSGSSVAWAILYPMDKLFESYIAALVKKYCCDYQVRLQDSRYHLFEEDRAFSLRPDIVLAKDDHVKILDTKWKKITTEKDISQEDMYQMFAYHYRYKEETKKSVDITLVYPEYKSYRGKNEYKFSDESTVNIKFVNLMSLIREEEEGTIVEKLLSGDSAFSNACTI